jgi:hypothetical protein
MKRHIWEFVRRGITAMGIGPLVLAVLYWILHRQGLMQTLTVDRVCVGILSLSALAFVAGGMNAIHQIERLPLMVGILIHGAVLYIAYLLTYLVNGWLEWGTAPVLVFSGIFVVGYLVIWAVIYAVIKRNTARVNEMLKEQQERNP